VLAVSAVLCGALAVGAVSPVWADDGGGGAGSGAGAPVLGGFALGDAIEGLIDERDGALTVSVPAGGVMLSWDSRAAGAAGASGLPAGWGFGLARVLTEGGVRVSPASGGLYELDASQPSGLAGYGLSDLRFEDVSAGGLGGVVLAARADGVVGERAVRFRLAELGGTVTSFDEAGRPLARVGATGDRVDWVHDDEGRLVRVVDADGVVTELDWDTEPGVLLVRPAANVSNESSDGVERVWRVELDDERMSAVEDPLGGRVEIGVRDGLVDRLSGVSGAVTEVEWQRFDDGVPRVETLQVADASGTVLSSRTWSRVGSSSSSGWPASAAVAPGPFGVQDPTLSYETELADGPTKIRSTYSGMHLLQAREVVTTTGAGESTIQEQQLTYPELPDGAFDPSDLPRAWSRPSSVEVTSRDASGGSRSVTTTTVFDELGRAVERTLSAAGATTPMLTAERRFDATGATVAKTLRDDRNARPGIEHHADAFGRVVSIVDQTARVGTVAYSPDGLPTREVTPSGQVTEIEYDQHTRRPVRTTVSSQAGDSVTTQADLDPVTGAVTSLFDPNDRAATEISYDYDAFGNTTELTDDAGAITERYGYTDYGSALESATAATDAPGLERNPYRYAGEFTDLDGSQFLTERLYLPHLMRFASDDRAPEHNDYAFGHLNPIMMIDPSGRTPSADTIAGWVLTGLGALASVASIAGAVLTGGGSMSLLGIAGWMAEGGALAAGAMTVADQFTPFLSDEQRLGLNVTEIVLGAASATVSRFGIAEYGQAEGATRRASGEFFQVLSQRRVVWVPHINATPFTHGTNLLLAERAVLADDLVRFGVRNSDQLPAPITTNLSAARNSLHTAFTNVGGGGVSWVAESLAKFRRIAADKRDALTSGWLTRSLSWQDEVAGVDRAVGDHAVAYAALKKMRPEEFAFIDDLQSMKLLITDLTPTSKTTNADLLQMIDSHLVPKYAPEPQRLVLLERGKN
jgi:RHS repeat-associated protein